MCLECYYVWYTHEPQPLVFPWQWPSKGRNIQQIIIRSMSYDNKTTCKCILLDLDSLIFGKILTFFCKTTNTYVIASCPWTCNKKTVVIITKTHYTCSHKIIHSYHTYFFSSGGCALLISFHHVQIQKYTQTYARLTTATSKCNTLHRLLHTTFVIRTVTDMDLQSSSPTSELQLVFTTSVSCCTCWQKVDTTFKGMYN
jgi:alpha-L-arabinofuranosidase